MFVSDSNSLASKQSTKLAGSGNRNRFRGRIKVSNHSLYSSVVNEFGSQPF